MKTPINKNSKKNKHKRNSLNKNFIDFWLIKIQIGIKKVVKSKKAKETPSTAKTIGPQSKVENIFHSTKLKN